MRMTRYKRVECPVAHHKTPIISAHIYCPPIRRWHELALRLGNLDFWSATKQRGRQRLRCQPQPNTTKARAREKRSGVRQPVHCGHGEPRVPQRRQTCGDGLPAAEVDDVPACARVTTTGCGGGRPEVGKPLAARCAGKSTPEVYLWLPQACDSNEKWRLRLLLCLRSRRVSGSFEYRTNWSENGLRTVGPQPHRFRGCRQDTEPSPASVVNKYVYANPKHDASRRAVGGKRDSTTQQVCASGSTRCCRIVFAHDGSGPF